MDEKALQAQLQELVCYLWDNYIQIFESVDDIFLMGAGNAYLGIKVLLMNRGKLIIPRCLWFL
jgi:histone deacetylase 6